MKLGIQLGAAVWCALIVLAAWTCNPPPDQPKPPTVIALPLSRDSIVALEAKRAGVPAGLAVAVSHVEDTSGDSLALSQRGAVGIMQVLPTYWLKAWPDECYGARSLFDQRRNACVGVRVLALYKQKYGSWHSALCAYHGSLALPGVCREYVEAVLENA